jgi:hypothetical protein
MDDFIVSFPNSLSDILCEEIIMKYELSEYLKYEGLTQSGVKKNVKDTTDLEILKNDPKWELIEKCLYKELNKAYKKYINFNKSDKYKNNKDYNLYNLIHETNAHIQWFMIQKYNKGQGKYIYHNDQHYDIDKNRYRIVTYIWYLIDVEEGGETEFFGGKIKIKPKRGTLILFPSSWCFPHRGIMPISNDKYIITGWFYIIN